MFVAWCLGMLIGAPVAGAASSHASHGPGRTIAAPNAEEQLAAKYAPIAELKKQTGPCDDVGEPYEPAPVDVVLGDPAVVLRENAGARDASGDPIVKTAPTVHDLALASRSDYLDLPGDPRNPDCTYERFFKQQMGTRPPQVYAHIATEAGRKGIALQYWFYYVFNRFNNLHESDWEMIQLSFAGATAADALEQEPTEIAYAQHEGGETARWDDRKLQKDGDHPIVYPAAGSHASYYGSHLYLGWGENGSGLGCDDSTGPSVRVPLLAQVVPDHPTATGPFAWLTYQGKWGEKDSWPFDGPTGPNMKRQWTQPFSWQDGLRKNSLALPSSTRTIGPNPTHFFCEAVSVGAGLFTIHKHYPWLTYTLGALLLLVPLALIFFSRGLLGAAVSLFWRNAATFFALGAFLILLSVIANLIEDTARSLPLGSTLVGIMTFASPSQLLVEGGSPVQQFVGWMLVTPAVVYTVAGIQAGRRPGIRAAYGAALARFWTLFRAGALAAVEIVALTISIVGIPWEVVKAVRWLFLVQAVVLKDSTWREARLVSERAVVGRWWQTAILSLSIALILSLLAPVIGLIVLIFVTPSVFVANTASGIAYALLFPLAGITTTLWYQKRPSRAASARAKLPWRRSRAQPLPATE